VDGTFFAVKTVALKDEANVEKSTLELTYLQLNILD
jgi:hypothetical protein